QPVQCCNTHDRIDRIVKWQGTSQVSLEDLHAVGVGAQPSTQSREHALRAVDGDDATIWEHREQPNCVAASATAEVDDALTPSESESGDCPCSPSLVWQGQAVIRLCVPV